MPRPSQKKTDGLTNKQKLFLAEYKKDCNGVRAAEAAGYSNPSVSASQLLDPDRYPLVVAEVKKMQREKSEKSGVDAAWIVNNLIKIAGFNARDLYDEQGRIRPLHELPPEVTYAIESIELGTRVVKDEDTGEKKVTTYIRSVKANSKLEALKQLAQHLGKLVDQVNVQNNIVLDWGTLARAIGSKPKVDVIEAKILEVINEGEKDE